MKPLRELFINRLKLRGFSERTIVNYTNVVHQITRHFMRSPLDLTKEQIESYRIFLLDIKKYAPATINLHMGALRTFFNIVKPESAAAITSSLFPMKVPEHLPVVLTRLEAEKLIAATHNLKHKSVLLLLYCSGLRLGECVNLKLTRIESARMKVRVEQGKGDKGRYTLLAQRTLDTLRNYVKRHAPKQWLFEGKTGGQYHPRSIAEIVSKATRNAGIAKNVTPHTLRHSFATHLMEVGIAVPIIKELLGHSSIKTTMHYLHVTGVTIDNIRSPFDEVPHHCPLSREKAA